MTGRVIESTASVEPRRSVRKRKVISYAEERELADDIPPKKTKVTATFVEEAQVQAKKVVTKKTTVKKRVTTVAVDITGEEADQTGPAKAFNAIPQQSAVQASLPPPTDEKRLRK